ncbi:ribonuclease J [Ureaplasma ceti]|uniref:RNase J family beta-CASP ribonuclease n=1 Tax=Ureaplasma ceti TaxID=3119530 RepID=A0ABP9UA19_9BACT
MAKIQVLPLGGQDERGKNCYIVQVDEDVYIFDCGVKVPINGQLGVSMITPDFAYLSKISSKIRGIFIGSPFFNDYAGLPYLLKQINPNTPVYCNAIAKIIIETYYEKKLKGLKLPNPKFKVVEAMKDIKIGKSVVTPFKVTNSITDSLGWVIKTEDGSIVFTDEFMINHDKTKAFYSQTPHLSTITQKNTLLLLPSLGNVGNWKGYTAPNHKNVNFYESVVKSAKGRVIVAVNDRDAYTILNLAQIAKQLGRPFSIYGNTFMNAFSGIVKNKLINTKGLNCLPISEINNSENAIVVCVSTQDNLFKKLASIVEGEVNMLQLKQTDTFVLGTQLVPGYEGHGARLMDSLSRLDIDSFILPRTILPMSASNEDHKSLVGLLQPKYILPIEGLYKSVVKYEQLMTETWIKKEQVIYLDNGEGVQFVNGQLINKKINIKLSEKYIGSAGVMDVGSSILHEREQMGDSGIILLTFVLDKNKQKFVKTMSIKDFGVVTKDERTQEDFQEIVDTFKENLVNYIVYDNNKKKIDTKETKLLLKKSFTKLFEKKFNKRPLVLPSIIEVTE